MFSFLEQEMSMDSDVKFIGDFNSRLKHIQNNDLSPKSKKKEINKLYWSNNRRKNKVYTKELEDKIEKLEKQVESLTGQLDKYR